MESSLQSIQNLVCNVLVALNGGVAVGSGLRTGNGGSRRASGAPGQAFLRVQLTQVLRHTLQLGHSVA